MPSSVMVSVPSYEGFVKSKTAESIGNAVEFAETEGLVERIVHRHVGGYGIARARNLMAQAALEEDVDFLWMVDSDMVVPEDSLAILLGDGWDVCTGWYVRGASDDGLTCVIKPGQQGFHDSYRACDLAGLDGLLSVKGNGLGCALVRTGVFRRLPKPWFRFVEHPDGSALGEDYYFCQQCASIGEAVWVDPRVACGHIHDRVLEPR